MEVENIIQLYKQSNTNFSANGDVVLTPVSAVISAKLNSTWELKLTHPIDEEGRWTELMPNAVIKAPSFMENDQLFRIRAVEKADSGINITAEPVFMDAKNEVVLGSIRIEKKNCKQALDIIFASYPRYNGLSDIKRVATASYSDMNGLEIINGDNENSFINKWGGEILFDNYKIIINERVGGDYGAELLYGRNIPADGLSEEVDFNNVCTRIFPRAYGGIIYLKNGVRNVDSPLFSKYPTRFSRVITYGHIKLEKDASDSDKDNPDIIVCKNNTELMNALETAAKEEFNAGIDKPAVTINADMALLKDSEVYKDFKALEDVRLGDTVHCRHSRLDIVSDARVIEVEYDAILKRPLSIKLGDFEYNYFNNISSKLNSVANRVEGAIRSDGSVIAERIQGFIDGAMASLKAQYNVVERQDVQAILFENLDKSSPMYGAVGIGTQGLQISKERTADGRGWKWTTAIDANGIIATNVITGLLASRDGSSYWNLDTGEMKVTGDVNMTSGTIEMNGDVVVSGMLESKDGTSYWDFDTGDVNMTGSFHVTGGEVQINTANDMDNHIELTGKSVYDHMLKGAMAPGEISINNQTLKGKTYMQGHMMAIDFPKSTIVMSVTAEDGKSPVLWLENKETKEFVQLGASNNAKNLIYCEASDGSATEIRGGRIICYGSDGFATFDSDDFKK